MYRLSNWLFTDVDILVFVFVFFLGLYVCACQLKEIELTLKCLKRLRFRTGLTRHVTYH